MKISKKLQDFLEKAKKFDSYWVEKAKTDFALNLEQQRRSVNLSYADIAKKIASSPAYITKIFRGDSNLTIESMVKLSRSVGGELDIRIVDKKSKFAEVWDLSKFNRPKRTTLVVLTTTTSVRAETSANHAAYATKEEVAA